MARSPRTRPSKAGALRRLRRHLWGVRAFLERDAALPEAVATFYMPRHRDPHAALAATHAREVA